MKKTTFGVAAVAVVSALLAACAPTQNTAGVPVREIPQGERGPVAGVGIEGHDIMAMTDRMMRDMLQSPVLAGAAVPPQVIVDGEYFFNESSQRINKNAIADRLRVNLNRAANGRMIFVARHNSDMVEQERDLKRAGAVDVGTTGLTRAQAGGDYRLSGRISSVDAVDVASGMAQRYNQVIFEMVDLERGTIVWSNLYEFTRAAADDVVYR